MNFTVCRIVRTPGFFPFSFPLQFTFPFTFQLNCKGKENVCEKRDQKFVFLDFGLKRAIMNNF